MTPSTIEAVLGARIATARREAGLTQEQLADRVGVGVQSVSRMERGRQLPTLVQLERVARALGVELSELVRRRESERRTKEEVALARVVAALRDRPAEDVERVAEVLELVFGERRGS